jgi:hypothetical protein
MYLLHGINIATADTTLLPQTLPTVTYELRMLIFMVFRDTEYLLQDGLSLDQLLSFSNVVR